MKFLTYAEALALASDGVAIEYAESDPSSLGLAWRRQCFVVDGKLVREPRRTDVKRKAPPQWTPCDRSDLFFTADRTWAEIRRIPPIEWPKK